MMFSERLRVLSDLDMGFTTVKMKIGGASLEEDVERIKAVLEVTGGAGDSLAVDANGRFDLETAKAYGKAMAPFNLKWYEEAGDPLDYQLQKELSADYPAKLSMATGKSSSPNPHLILIILTQSSSNRVTGENLFSMQDARNLIRYGGMHPVTLSCYLPLRAASVCCFDRLLR